MENLKKYFEQKEFRVKKSKALDFFGFFFGIISISSPIYWISGSISYREYNWFGEFYEYYTDSYYLVDMLMLGINLTIRNSGININIQQFNSSILLSVISLLCVTLLIIIIFFTVLNYFRKIKERVNAYLQVILSITLLILPIIQFFFIPNIQEDFITKVYPLLEQQYSDVQNIDLWMIIPFSPIFIIISAIFLVPSARFYYRKVKIYHKLKHIESKSEFKEALFKAEKYNYRKISNKAKEILKPIQMRKLKNTESENLIKEILEEAELYNMKSVLNAAKKKLSSIQKQKIKKIVLELGTKFPRLQIDDIAEKTMAYNDLIIETIKEMIKNNEIHAEYFERSKSVAFNQQTNIDEIDDLMVSFKDWEKKGNGKKE